MLREAPAYRRRKAALTAGGGKGPHARECEGGARRQAYPYLRK